jgi:hypothetical protein
MQNRMNRLQSKADTGGSSFGCSHIGAERNDAVHIYVALVLLHNSIKCKNVPAASLLQEGQRFTV